MRGIMNGVTATKSLMNCTALRGGRPWSPVKPPRDSSKGETSLMLRPGDEGDEEEEELVSWRLSLDGSKEMGNRLFC